MSLFTCGKLDLSSTAPPKQARKHLNTQVNPDLVPSGTPHLSVPSRSSKSAVPRLRRTRPGSVPRSQGAVQRQRESKRESKRADLVKYGFYSNPKRLGCLVFAIGGMGMPILHPKLDPKLNLCHHIVL